MFFHGDSFVELEPKPNFFQRFFQREVAVAPEWWNAEFDGEFTVDHAAMHGIPTTRRINWLTTGGAVVALLLAIATPIIIFIRKKRSRLNFDDED